MEGLALFPEAGLSSAVITTVFVGVLVSIFFNLRLGWPLVGLVIPGYLAPLFLAQPRMAAFSVLEGMLGYLFFFILTSLAHRFGVWPNLFGRDRFFAVVLMSIVTRICVDGFFLSEAYPFHSVGFILTALMINYYWTSGIKSGFFMMCVTTAITAVIVRYGLMEFTNFRLSQINYLYLESWSAFLESPKIYMVLAATAFIASRMNFSYGLDFGGLIIPALLALQWYDPIRILITLIEAWFIYLLGSALIRALLSRESILGGRKIAFFFSIGFLYKMVSGFFLLHFFPDIKALDYYGFGYLLSTFIAIKIYDIQSGFRTTRALVQTSFYGLVIGLSSSALLALSTPEGRTLLQKGQINLPKEITPVQSKPIENKKGFLVDLVMQIQDQDLVENSIMKESAHDLLVWDQHILTPLITLVHTQNTPFEHKTILEKINGAAHLYGYEVYVFQTPKQQYFVLDRKNPQSPYRGTYILSQDNKKSPYVITIPYVDTEAYTFERGLDLLEDLNASALFLSQTPSHFSPNGYISVTALEAREQNILTLAKEDYLKVIQDDACMFVEVRGLASPNFLDPKEGGASLQSSLMIALSEGTLEVKDLSILGKKLWQSLHPAFPDLTFANGSLEGAGYEGASSKTLTLLNRTLHKELAILWFPLKTRMSLSWPGHNAPLLSQLGGLGIPINQGILTEVLLKEGTSLTHNFSKELSAFIERYRATNDVFYLPKMLDTLSNLKPLYFMDKISRRGIFLFKNDRDKIVMGLNLQGTKTDERILDKKDIKEINLRVVQNQIFTIK